MATPSIACLSVIGKNNNPLHISIFPSYAPFPATPGPLRTPLQFSLLLSSSLDIFEARARSSAALTGDYGLLQALDERLSLYGFETNTGVKFVAVVDMMGRGEVERAPELTGGREKGKGAVAGNLREADVKIVFKAMQAAYIRLLQNPFYNPDEHSPTTGRGGKKISSRRFEAEMRRIGEAWTPGVANL